MPSLLLLVSPGTPTVVRTNVADILSLADSPAMHAFAFVPAVLDGKRVYAKPMEVYSDPSAALLGFRILAPDLAAEASRLKLAAHPSPAAIVAALTASPPPTIARAKGTFAYLSSQVSAFANSQTQQLSKIAFVPVQATATSPVTFVAPAGSFFSTDAALPLGLRGVFTTLPEFGVPARPFLIAVGVKETPSVVEIAELVLRDPAKFFELSGSSERYLSVLRLLASNYASLPSTLRSRAKLSPFILGTKRLRSAVAKPAKTLMDDDDSDAESSGSLVYKLARASELCLNDDPPAFSVFQHELLCAPQEDAIELLCSNLGSLPISQLVKEHWRVVGEPDSGSQRATELRRTVGERTVLFLAERRAQYGKAELRHDAEWVQKHLEVREVRAIELLRTVTVAGVLKKNVQEAFAHAKAEGGGIVLYSELPSKDRTGRS